MQSGVYRFAYWKLNGTRKADSFGISLTAFNFSILENSDAVAVYMKEDLDSSGQGVPDWYKLFQYGTLAISGTSDTDGDGVSLLNEYLKGSQPRIPDSAADGGIVQGGVSRRRGEKIAVSVGAGYHLYTESSTPPGIVARREYLKEGTTVTTANLNGETNGYRFTQWKVNGVRQENGNGVALMKLETCANIVPIWAQVIYMILTCGLVPLPRLCRQGLCPFRGSATQWLCRRGYAQVRFPPGFAHFSTGLCSSHQSRIFPASQPTVLILQILV
jgi:hypothetical protein